MKNLKKVLALGLALIMLLGMFTVVSAAETKMVATDFTDWDSVEHKDAVTLMVDLGIINGIKGDNNTYAFKPTENIDRASWAKMVYYAATGSDDADAFVGVDTGLVDIAGSWAVGYISYLKANEMISGDGLGNYNPTAPITVAAANKMMLTTLGYNAKANKYQDVGTVWAANVMNDAKKYGLMDDVDRGQTADVNLTRENAAQIIYNAMRANTVKPVTEWDMGIERVKDYTKVGTLGYDVFNVIAVEATVGGVSGDGYATFTANDIKTPLTIGVGNTTTLATKMSNAIKAPINTVGDTVVVWVDVNGATIDDKGVVDGYKSLNNVVTSAISKGVNAADYVFTQGFKWEDLTNPTKNHNFVAKKFHGVSDDVLNDAESTRAQLAGDCAFYINGTAEATAPAIRTITAVTWDNDAEELPGTVVEFYLDEDDGTIATVRAYIYQVAQLTADAETRTTGGVLQVKVPGVGALSSFKSADKVSGYQGLKEGDVVLYYTTGVNGDNYVIEKCDKVTGKVSYVDGSRLVINGSKYKRTAMDKAPTYCAALDSHIEYNDFIAWENLDDEFDFFLDKSGAVCWTEQITETFTKSNIALVMAAEWNGTSLTVDSGSLKAKLLFIDGTQQVVTVSKVNNLSVVTTLSAVQTQADKQIVGGNNSSTIQGSGTDAIDVLNLSCIQYHEDSTYPETTADSAPAKDLKFWNYKVVDGKYELAAVEEVTSNPKTDDWDATIAFSNSTISRQGDFANGDVAYGADSKTVFLVAKGDSSDKTYYTYTSFKNIPEMEGAWGIAVATHDGAASKYVFIDTQSYNDDVPDGYVFVINNSTARYNDAKGNAYYTINVVDTDGTVGTLKVNDTIATAVAADKKLAKDWGGNAYVGKFATVDTIGDDGVVTGLTAVTSMKQINRIGNEVVMLQGATDSWSYDNVTKFICVDLQISEGDKVDDATDDVVTFSSAGTFTPDGFYNGDDVGFQAMGQTSGTTCNTANTAFQSVYADVICGNSDLIADYVYVYRIAW